MQKLRFARTLTAWLMTSALFASTLVAQDGGAAADQPAAGLSAQELATLVRSGTLEEAADALEAAVAAAPNESATQNLRSLLASRAMRAGNNDLALAQYEKLAEFQIANVAEPNVGRGLGSTVSTLTSLYMRANRVDAAEKLRDDALAAVMGAAESDTSGTLLPVYSHLTSIMAGNLANEGKVADALLAVAAARDTLVAQMQADETAENAIVASSQLLSLAVTIASRNAPDQVASLDAELNELMSSAMTRFPNSAAIASQFVTTRTTAIGRIYRDEPEAARELLHETITTLENLRGAEDRLVTSSIARLRQYESRIDAALLLAKLIGQPAPAMDVEAWAHGAGRSANDLKGKVVLLDFWAVWCGPCIATFPHLIELHDEFHDQGLEIIGVTRQYNYSWDADAGRASKSADELTLEDEVAALDRFMEHHQLKHATIVTPVGSTMSKEFGVTGIPHAVLIDRKGVVRMIKVGSGKANADALHAMIRELIAEE